jgi:phosphatidylserine synthase
MGNNNNIMELYIIGMMSFEKQWSDRYVYIYSGNIMGYDKLPVIDWWSYICAMVISWYMVSSIPQWESKHNRHIYIYISSNGLMTIPQDGCTIHLTMAHTWNLIPVLCTVKTKIKKAKRKKERNKRPFPHWPSQEPKL